MISRRGRRTARDGEHREEQRATARSQGVIRNGGGSHVLSFLEGGHAGAVLRPVVMVVPSAVHCGDALQASVTPQGVAGDREVADDVVFGVPRLLMTVEPLC